MSSILVRVKAGNNAFVLLSQQEAKDIQDNKYVEIGLGVLGNQKSVIRVGIQSGADLVDTPNILDASTYRDFWVSWDYYTVKIGYGLNVGQYVFMENGYPSTLIVKEMGSWNGRSLGNKHRFV